DWDFLARFLLMYEKIEHLDRPLVRYRLHGDNMSQRIEILERDMLRCFEKLFADPHLPGDVHARKAESYAGLYKMLAASYLEARRPWAAARNGAKSVVARPE